MKSGQKIRVLHLTTHLDPGGISSYIRLLVRTLAAQGRESAVASAGGSLCEELENERIPAPVFDIRTKNEFHPKLVRAAFDLARYVKDGHFTVVHAHTRVTQVLGAWVSALSGVPLVTTAHGFFRPKLGRRLYPCWGSRVIAISPSVAEDLQRSHGVSADRVRTVLNAIDQPSLERRFSRLSSDEAKEFLALKDRFPLVVSVGRLVEDKGHAHLIDACAALLKDYPRIHLLIVGEGRQKAALLKRIHNRGLSAHASLIGDRPDLAAVYRACDIFVHPATYREGFGLSLAEAMYAEKPVVATRIPALDRLFSDGDNALLVPPASAQALERAMRYLLESPQDAARIAQSGARWARTVCRPERFADEIVAVYKEAQTFA